MSPKEIEELLAMPREALTERWQVLIGEAPPNRLSRQMMARIIATELQWQTSGLSRKSIVRKLERAISAAASNKPTASPGTRLVREWNGRQYVVDIIAEGYLWNDRTWSSLSAIAKEITGTKWSGPRFFGVAT